jgi:hypothetical protein
MKTFKVYQDAEGKKFRIEYRYRNAGAKRYTVRQSIYYTEADALRAAQGFANRGYKPQK